MNRILACLVILGFPAQEPPPVAKSDPMTPADQQKAFHLPPGFEIQLVASEPDINKPMNLAFDDRGRLFVTSSVEYPFPAKEGIPPRDSVKMLEDFGPDGRARKITTFVPGLNIPIGVVPTADGVLCHGIPKIWKCTDADADGKAEKREPLYGDVGSRDTHGMVNAFTPWVDGWIYACHGFANHSELKSATTGSSIVMDSGNTFRMKPDGSQIEYYSHGQVNPFGLSFDPLGNLFSADCHSKPLYQLLRGGWYETFGGQHDGLGPAPLMMNHLHGSTAIGGIVYYAATQFPAAYRDTLLVGNPVTGRINHDRLEKHGSTLKAIEQPDFLKCDDRWFRPVDLELAPDGSIYVADFYNRIIGHYEVPLDHPGRDRERGRIWRIVYTGADATPPRPMPDLFKCSAVDLATLLGDADLQLRVRATNQLVERIGRDALPAVKLAMTRRGLPERAHGLWVLERLGALEEADVRKAAEDADVAVRVHLLKLLGERKAWTFEAELVRARLKDGDAFVRRAAAEALGLHPARENLKPLIDLWAATPADDTHLIHMARMALRDQLRATGYGPVAGMEKEAVRRIVNVSPGVKSEESAAFVLGWMKDGPPDAALLRYVTRYVQADGLASVFDYAKGLESRPAREQMPFIRAVQQAVQERGAKLPDAFTAWARVAVAAALGAEDKAVAGEAIKLCRELRLREAYEDLERLAARGKSPDLRTAALDALPAVDAARAVPTLARIAAVAEEAMMIRQRAVAALGAVNSPAARADLVKLLQAAPQPLAVPIAIALAGTREGGEALLGAIGEGKGSPRLLVEKAVEGRLRATNAKELIERRDKIVKDLPPEDERVAQLMKARQKGYAGAKPNPARGAELFAKACAGCHKLDGKGQKVGPELDAIYTRGVDRLLEDILDPNRNVDQAFRASLIKTTDGRVISGLVVREEGEVLVIQEAVDKETRLPKKEIEQRVLSQLSPMPTNVIDPLPEADFYDLLAYLLQPRAQK